MSRKKINLKTLVWPKYAISAVLLSAITAATLGTMYFYSKNSDDNLGKENPTKRDDLVNEFIDRSTPPKTYFIEAQNQATKEQYDPKTDTVILSDGSVVSTVDYLDAYYKKHHAMPYLKISYGSFNFFNQYIEAVSPIEFFKFTEWFMNNVSWGPEIITLKSFSIVKGVEMNGNNITLGSHSNRNKEYTTIKFFPDAFFGTLPIYSELDGRGNAQDSLTYKLNRKILTAKEVQTFLGNISRYNSLSNLSTNTVNSNFFRDIINIQDLKGLKLFAIKNENWFKEIKDISINQTEKSRLFFNNPYLLLIDGKNEAEARQKLIEKFEEYKKHDVYKVLENINPNTVALEEKIITDAKIQDNQATPTDIISDGYLNITFNDNTNMRIFKSFQDVQSRDKNSTSTELTFRNNYFQIDEALVKAKEDLDELESKYQDYIRSKISTNNFGEDEILSLKNKADEYIETVRNLARIEQRLTPMEQDYTAQGTLVIQVEQEEKEISELQKSNEKLDAEIKQLEQEIDSESNETEKAKKQQQLTEKRNQVNDNNTNINAKQERIRQLRPRILSEQALQNLKNEIDNLKNQLNNLLKSSNEIAKIYNDISILRRPSEYIEFSELIRGYSDIYSNSTFKMIKENKIDDSTDLQKIETLKIFFNELFKFNNIYNRITYPYENNGAAYTTPSYVENEFYKVDIAFLPNTLITMDSLVKSSEKAQLNWRDFYNLKGFLNDRKNIVGENNQDVFIYVDKSKVSELGINKGKLEFNYKELNNKLDEVNLKITNTQEKINNIQNLISNTNNSNSIASLMTSFYRQNSILPFNFRPIGNSNTDDIISNEQVFTVLLGDNATGLPAYLNVLKNGNSSSNDEFHKVGTNGLLELIRNKVPEDQRSLFDLLVENTNKRLELDSVVSTNFDVEKINEYLTALVTLNEKSLEWENLNKSKSWYFDYSQLNTAITLIKNVDRSLEIINENNINENEIISLQENLNNLILESNFYRYQIKKLSELPTFDNEEINEAYNKIVKEFNDKKEEYSLFVKNLVKVRNEASKARWNSVNTLINSSEPNVITQAQNVLSLEDIESKITAKEAELQKFTTSKDELKNRSDEALRALIERLNIPHSEDGDLTRKEAILNLANPIKAIFDEFVKNSTNDAGQTEFSWYETFVDIYTNGSQDAEFKGIKEFQKDIEKALEVYNSTSDEKVKDEQSTLIDQASQAIQTRLGFLQRLRVFYLYFQEKSNQYQTLLDEVNRGEKPATDFHVLLFRISGELAEFLNNTQLNPFPPFVGRIVSQIKNLIDTNNQTITTKYRLSVHTLYETYNSIQTNYGDALRLEQVAQIELESLKAQKTSFEKIQTNSELQNQLQKVKENVSILESFSEKQNEYNNLFNHLYPAELDNSLAILSDAENKMKELEETISTFLNNDLVVKKARENLASLKDTKSKLNKSLDEIKEIDKSSGFEEAFNELNQKLEEFEKVVDNFSNDYKYSLFYVTLRVQGLLGENSSSIDRRNAINDILKQTNFSNDEKNVLVTTVEYFDNIKRPKNIRDQISTIQDSVLLIVDKLANAYKQTAPLKSKFIDELKENFNNKVLSVFAQLNEADKNNASISEQIKNINNAITNFDKELAKEHIQSELLDVYKSRLNNISQELASIVSEDARGGYINSLLALLVHDAWERYNKEEEKLTRILLPVVTFESINDKGKLISEVNKKISEIDAEIESERLFLNLDPSKRDEKEAKIADLEAQKSKEQEKIKSLEKITEIIKGLERYTGEYVKYDRNTFTSANDIRSLFNATVDTFITRENNINTSLNRAKEKLSEFREYFNINISSYDLDKRLLNIYNKAVEDSSNLLINSRINEINRQTLENALLTEKGFDLLDSEEIHISKSRIKLIDELTKKGILKANATDEEINNLIYKVNLTNITKDNSVLTLTFRERSKTSNAAYSPDYITTSLRGYSNKFIKVNIDANISDKRVSAINEIFSELGYKKLVSPTLIKESGNILNSETGLSEKGYDVFADAYENLTSNLLEEVPYAGEWLNGEHIVKKLDENGEFVYSIENGPYLGFSKDSRVGLWAILKMSDPNFKGISTDFLKFVGAHEYGHHMTLNGAQDLGNKGNKPIFISALTPNGTPNINNYYSRDVVELYLDARTHVKMGAKRLLDQFGVLRDYGEYPEFYFAKKENDSISYEDKVETLVKSLESEKDIWGVDLNDQSLREALKNKKRRFLQNFSGLLEAVKARREANGLVAKDDEKWLQPFDLWILNAVDNFSATLNPSMSGTAKYMVKENGKYVYKDASIRMLDGVLKDGAGNKVVFEEQVQDNEVRFLPKVVDGERNSEGQYILIREVLMKNKNGSPVINVPLNVRLDDQNNPNYDANAVQYVNSTIDRITRAIQSLIVERYTINGWDNSTTNLSVEPRINIDFGALRSTFGNAAPSTITDLFFNIYKDYVKNRDPETGQYNGGPRNNLMKYYNNDGTLNTTEFTQTVPSSLIYANPRIVSQNNELSFGNVISTIFSSGNKFNNVMSGGEGQILFIDKEHQYLPNVNNTKAFGQMFFNDSIGENLIRRFEIKRNLRWMASYTPQFISNRTNANVIWLMKDSRNNDINGTAFNNYEYDNLAKLSINYNDRLANEDSNAISGLFGYIKDKNNRKAGEISFDNYNDWLDFVTVDLRKARYNSNTKTIDWNIDYVSSKVDIEEFKNNFESNVLVKLRNNDEEVYNAYLEFFKEANKDTTNQLWANEIMKRFSLTDYAMYTSNITIQDIKDNPDYAWIFDAKLGYGEFKKESFRIENHNPEEWQISTDGIISAYEKLAEKFESSLSSLNLYDTLIFDSKIQGYSDQTFINVSLRKFDLLSIFSSLFTGTFETSPSTNVRDYFRTKNERNYNEFFSDYTYSFAEVINRDNLQITYSPSIHEFGNMPNFLSGISEANTGLEYIVDGTTTEKWLNKAIRFNDQNNRNGIRNSILEYERIFDQEASRRAKNLNLKYSRNMFAVENDFNDAMNYSNNYFGQFQSINNGWFRDRWYREFLDFKLYDDNGMPIVDDTIRIKNLEGNVAKDRVEAYWNYYIQSQGVGKRNVSGIWRDQDKDAIAMFGYLTKDIAEKANFIAFKDKDNGEIKTIAIKKQNTNNMFYYKTQDLENEIKFNNGDTSVRHTLAEEKYDYTDKNGHHKGEGFVSWVTNYEVMSRYRDNLLKPGLHGKRYEMYFASDESGKERIAEIDLGDYESVSENGKTFSQAPTKIEKVITKDKDGNIKETIEMVIFDQFNGVNVG